MSRTDVPNVALPCVVTQLVLRIPLCAASVEQYAPYLNSILACWTTMLDFSGPSCAWLYNATSQFNAIWHDLNASVMQNFHLLPLLCTVERARHVAGVCPHLSCHCFVQ